MTSAQNKACKCGQPRHHGVKCRECYNAYMKDYMSKYNKTDKRRDTYLKHRYNITLDQYTKMLAGQGNVCKMCGSDDPGANKRFEVDHDHSCCDGDRSCGRCIRGLLCSRCNTGIACFEDDEDKLLKAVAYLRAWRA